MATPRPRRAKRVPHYESAAYLSLVARTARNLRLLRNERRWTQEEAGARCGMLMQQYQRIEGGRVNLTFATLARLADGFGVDPQRLLAPPEIGAESVPEAEASISAVTIPDEVVEMAVKVEGGADEVPRGGGH